MRRYATQKLVISCLCGLGISSCSPLDESWFIPDRLTLNYGRSQYETLGAMWDAGGDRFNTFDAESQSFNIGFEYDLKPRRTEIVHIEGIEGFTAAINALVAVQGKRQPVIEVKVAAPVIPPAMVEVKPTVTAPDVKVEVNPVIKVEPAEVRPVIEVVPDVTVTIPKIEVVIHKGTKADTEADIPQDKKPPKDPHEDHGFSTDFLAFFDRLINGSIAAILNFLLVVLGLCALGYVVWKCRDRIPLLGKGKPPKT